MNQLPAADILHDGSKSLCIPLRPLPIWVCFKLGFRSLIITFLVNFHERISDAKLGVTIPFLEQQPMIVAGPCWSHDCCKKYLQSPVLVMSFPLSDLSGSKMIKATRATDPLEFQRFQVDVHHLWQSTCIQHFSHGGKRQQGVARPFFRDQVTQALRSEL